MDEWKGFDPCNLSDCPDILVPGAWEIEYQLSPVVGWVGSLDPDGPQSLVHAIQNGLDCRRRRPEGWEPKECPRCGSPNKSDRVFISSSRKPPISDSHAIECPDPWHDEPEAPTLGDIKEDSFRGFLDECRSGNIPGGCPKVDPEAPTHEDKLTLWWYLPWSRWGRAIGYSRGLYWFMGSSDDDPIAGLRSDEFTNRQSAPIPPEKE